MRCTNCGSLAIDFADSQAIVSDITFAENTAGGAVVQGSYLGVDQVRTRTNGPGFRGSSAGESRECTIANARWNINRMATARGVPAHVAERALRFFQLALDGGTTTASGSQPKNFVLGRKSDYTVASCLYVACRMAKTTHMLIDFADVIQVNVFVLGRSYLRLLRVLNLQMPLIDPSFYISRFAALLEFGDETQRVVTDATRLVTRFKTDWMVEGRRPAGICGACLLLAARMNHFRRSITEIVQVVKIADVTLRKRLEEFKNTPSGQLTIEDFRSVWLEEENNPPAFSRARAPRRDKIGDAQAVAMPPDEMQAPPENEPLRNDIEQLAEQATEQEINSFLQQADIHALDTDLIKEERQRVERAKAGLIRPESTNENAETQPGMQTGTTGTQEDAPAPVNEAQDDLADLDEEELDSLILSEEEVKIKERVWMEFNKDYLEAALARQLKLEADQRAGIAPAPRNRKRQKPRDATTAPTGSAAESAKQMMQQKRWSRRINYDVLNSLFPSTQGNSKDARLGSKPTGVDVPDDVAALEGDTEGESDEDDDDRHASKRSRTENDWMALGGLQRPSMEDEMDYNANESDDVW
ncbi:transcription factor TFIIIB subunit brf1 [Malassezia nana]|uniref:B-related factor 1 n=1 Tax=Malassezia nana TaxID=180528 RepID=A0AAF0EQF6_9BASI|nr:transcription factor TFIIIB subunit brf1 [Malassezia nana]